MPWFASLVNRTEETCPPFSRLLTQRDNSSECVCDPGFFMADGSCVPCVAGYYCPGFYADARRAVGSAPYINSAYIDLFGIVCSFHVFWAKISFNGLRNGNNVDIKELSKPQWNFISCLYAILSVSAKTALEAGLVMYVSMYEEWLLLRAAKIEKHAMQDETCWAIKP